jgi:hypothetical protein
LGRRAREIVGDPVEARLDGEVGPDGGVVGGRLLFCAEGVKHSATGP